MELSQNNLINVRDPDTLEIGSIPATQISEAQSQGFQPVSHDELKSYVQEQKYGSPSQQAATALEGAASAASFGLSPAFEIGLGISKPEDIQARRETNPVAHGVGEVAGLVGSSFVPGGAGNLIERAGQAAADKLIPMAAESVVSKIGSTATKMAVENALMTSGDEVSKMFTDSAPAGQAAQSAIANIGLSSLIGGVAGGAFGAAQPLWQATAGSKLNTFLEKFKNRLDGASVPIADELEPLLKSAPPEIRAGFSQDPAMMEHFQTLRESGTPSGQALRETIDAFQSGVRSNLESVFNASEGTTAFQAGTDAKANILSKAEEMNNKVKSAYDEVADATGIQVSDEERLKYYDSLIEKGQEFGAKGSPASELFKVYGERLLAQDTIGQMDKLVTEVNSARNVAWRAGDFEKSRALSEISDGIRDFQENQISKQSLQLAKATEDPNVILSGELLKQQRAQARSQYKEFIEKIGDIASVGKLGKVKSFSQLQEALENVPAAKFAEKLFDKKNVEGLDYIKKNFPDVFESLVNQKKAEIWEAANKTGDLQHNRILNSVNSLPKEVKNLMFSSEEQELINSSGELLRKANIRMNASGTARTADSLFKYMPAGIGGAIGTLMGHPIIGTLLGEATSLVGRNAPDAMKLALLKFMGGSGQVEAGAFKAMVDYMAHAAKGELMLNKAVSSVFKSTPSYTISDLIPTAKDRDRLEKRIVEIQENPSHMLNVSGDTGAYLPNHASAISQTAMNAVNYLNQAKPRNEKQSPLDPELPLSTMQKSQFNRKLDIAQSPLMLLQDIKDGTITHDDVTTIQSIYPDLFSRMQFKLLGQMNDQVADKEPIPYKSRMGLSLFLQIPLDSTMQPQSIATLQAQNNLIGQQNAQEKLAGTSADKLSKYSNQFLTPGQASEASKLKN